MRMTWERRKASPLAAVNRMHFVMWDFLKMLLATVICGIAVSLAAAAITLVLSNAAYAATLFNDSNVSGTRHSAPPAPSIIETQVFPGALLFGDGCDADLLDATDRDWKITINGKYIDVRVMQTFIMPPGDATAATFNASLPAGVRLLRFNVHTSGSFWQGQVVNSEKYDELTAIDLRQLSRRGILIVQNDEGVISTDAIINIAASEAVTVEYTYRTTTEDAKASQDLFVVLANENIGTIQLAGSRAPNATVWVEWVGNNPSHLTHVPGGAFLDTADSKITGLSWTGSQSGAGTRFHLAWST